MDFQKPPEILKIVRIDNFACNQKVFIAKNNLNDKLVKNNKWELLECIAAFQIPKDWKASEPGGQGIVNCSMHPPNKDFCYIEIAYHSYGLVGGSAPERSLRKKLLQAPIHDLSEFEVDKLHYLLFAFKPNGSNPHRKLEKCETVDLNGKRVIYLESSDKRFNYAPFDPDTRTFAFLVDPTGEGKDFLSIKYRADVKVFDKYKETVLRAIKSVKWKAVVPKYDGEDW